MTRSASDLPGPAARLSAESRPGSAADPGVDAATFAALFRAIYLT